VAVGVCAVVVGHRRVDRPEGRVVTVERVLDALRHMVLAALDVGTFALLFWLLLSADVDRTWAFGVAVVYALGGRPYR
jgi:hypothetical protein